MNVSTTAMRRVAGLAPRRLRDFGDGTGVHSRSGTILFADIAGFTAMTEAARRVHGARGIEELTARLNAVFGEMVAAVHQYGGDVLKFGGDALLVAFDRGDRPLSESSRDALAGARALDAVIAHHRTRGQARLSLHLGVAGGEWTEIVAGRPGERREHFVHGKTVVGAIQEASAAPAGVCRLHARSGGLSRELTESIRAVGRNRWEIRLASIPDGPEPHIERPMVSTSPAIWDFVPEPLRPLLAQDDYDPLSVAEHRRVCTLFVFWRGVSADVADGGETPIWQEVFEAAFDCTHQTSGLWARSDPGDVYQKLLILFGSPSSADDDIERAVRCATLLRDRFAALRSRRRGLRAGIGLTTATVFTGWVGGADRFEFTAMGEGVNLAARLASMAPFGTVLVDTTTRQSCRGWRYANGPVLMLKGVRKPVETFRPIEPRTEEVESDEDALVEHPDALERCLQFWEETGTRTIWITAHADADSRKFLRQFIQRAGTDPQTIARIRFQSQDGTHPHGGLRRFLMEWCGVAGDEGLRQRVDHCPNQFRQALDIVLGPDIALARALEQSGVEAWTDRVARAVRDGVLTAPTDHARSLIVLDQYHCLSEIDRMVFRRIVSGDLPVCRFIVVAEQTASTPEQPGSVLLGPLAKPDFRRFVQQLLSGTAASGLLSFLYEQSCGLARLARMHLAHLRDHGLLIEPRGRGGLWRLGDVSGVDLPDALRVHHIQRVDRLPAAGREVIRVIAVLGDGARDDAVQQLLGSSGGSISETIAGLSRSGLIESTASGDGRILSFSDRGCRQAVYETMSYAVREQWHRAAARYWKMMGPGGTEQCGEHLFRARDQAALPYLERAATRARKLWLLERARLLYRWALLASVRRCDPEFRGALPPLPKSLSPVQRRLLRPLGDILQVQGEYDIARAVYDRLADDGRRRDDNIVEGEARLFAARMDWFAGRYGRTAKQARRVLRLARNADSPRLTAQAEFLLGETARRTGHLHPAEAALQTAIGQARRAGDRALESDAGNALGLVLWSNGRLESARAQFETALRLSGGRRDPAKRAQITNNLGILLEESGRLRASERYYRKSFDIFDRLGHRRNRAYSLGNLANLSRHTARYEQARAAYEEVELELRSIGEAHAAAYTIGNRGDLALDFGDWSTAHDLFHQTLRFALHAEDAELIAESYARLAQLLLAQNRISDARRHLHRAAIWARKAGSREFQLRADLLQAECDLKRGRVAGASRQFAAAAERAVGTGLVYYQLWAQLGQSACAVAEGDGRSAVRLARIVRRMAGVAGYRWWEFRAAVVEATALSKTAIGGPGQSRFQRALHQALDLQGDIERSIGDTAVREQFLQSALVRDLNGLARHPSAIPAAGS